MAKNIKKNIMAEINNPYLTKKQMQKLPTHRLLAYKRKHLSYNTYAFCGLCDGPCARNAVKYAKEIAEWETAYNDIKEILSTREHIIR